MKQRKTVLVLVLFSLGIFMGAIDTGIVSPAREIIQNGFGVERNIGMWVITIYTLFYAIAMPIVSKMADRYGHKKVYTISIAIFGFGSLLCGLSNFYGNFEFLLIARVIQAIGGGGILPIAITVIGQSFPVEKRGMALGLVGGIFGVATIIGPTLGSTILNITGTAHWGWIFFINVPICLTVLTMSSRMEGSELSDPKPLDFAGAGVLALTIGSIMYALTKTNFFNIVESIKDINVFPFLIAFIVLIPILIMIEKKAKDPILNLKYFKSRQMILIFILAFVVGVGMMGMVFIPQFAENVLKIKAGSGGYLVTLLAVFSGIAAPLSGRLLDKKGARLVIALGFVFNIIGTLFLGYVVTQNSGFIWILIGLAFMGLGVGFTIGAPLNYLILAAVPHEEGATAMATMSLIRSIGISVSPSIMIGFIANAAKNLPQELSKIPGIPSTTGGADAQTAKLFQSLQTADVTTIVGQLKGIIKQVVPAAYRDMALQGIEKMRTSIENIFQTTINKGYTHMFTAAAIIAAVGLAFTVFLRKRAVSVRED